MSLTYDHHYCQPVSTCFSSAIFTQPDTTEGISVELGWVKQDRKKTESRAKAKVTICTLSNSGENITKKSPFPQSLNFQKICILHCKMQILHIFLKTIDSWSFCAGFHFWEMENLQKISILHCKIVFFCLKMNIPQVCPRGRDIHFWVMENMQKISILQCKMEIFCFFGGSRKCISHKFAPGVEIFIAGKWKICKKSPFYTVKLRFFEYLVAPENAYPTVCPK